MGIAATENWAGPGNEADPVSIFLLTTLKGSGYGDCVCVCVCVSNSLRLHAVFAGP